MSVFNDKKHTFLKKKTTPDEIKYKYIERLGAREHIAFILHSMCIELLSLHHIGELLAFVLPIKDELKKRERNEKRDRKKGL